MIGNLTGGQLRAGAEAVCFDGRRLSNDEIESGNTTECDEQRNTKKKDMHCIRGVTAESEENEEDA